MDIGMSLKSFGLQRQGFLIRIKGDIPVEFLVVAFWEGILLTQTLPPAKAGKSSPPDIPWKDWFFQLALLVHWRVLFDAVDQTRGFSSQLYWMTAEASGRWWFHPIGPSPKPWRRNQVAHSMLSCDFTFRNPTVSWKLHKESIMTIWNCQYRMTWALSVGHIATMYFTGENANGFDLYTFVQNMRNNAAFHRRFSVACHSCKERIHRSRNLQFQGVGIQLTEQPGESKGELLRNIRCHKWWDPKRSQRTSLRLGRPGWLASNFDSLAFSSAFSEGKYIISASFAHISEILVTKVSFHSPMSWFRFSQGFAFWNPLKFVAKTTMEEIEVTGRKHSKWFHKNCCDFKVYQCINEEKIVKSKVSSISPRILGKIVVSQLVWLGGRARFLECPLHKPSQFPPGPSPIFPGSCRP